MIYEISVFLLFLLICLSAFYSSAETSLMSLGKAKKKQLTEKNKKVGDLIEVMMKQPNRLLVTILVGNNIVNIAASAIATAMAIRIWGQNGVGIATAFMTVLVLVFGEIVPKSVSARFPDVVAAKIARGTFFSFLFLKPLVFLITRITGLILRLFKYDKSMNEIAITEEELKILINLGHEEGVLEKSEKQMLQNVLRFTDAYVKDVMLPRNEVVFVKQNASYDDVRQLFRQHRYSRLPVVGDVSDDVVGVLNLRDFIWVEQKEAFNLMDLMHEPFFSYEFQKVQDLFEDMRKAHTMFCIVLDEFGATAGIVTMEDIVEEVVGEIEDEYDESVELLQKEDEKTYIVNGTIRLEHLNNELGITLKSEHYETLGGYMIDRFGYLPDVNEHFFAEGYDFTVLIAENNTVKQIRVRKRKGSDKPE